MSPKVIYVPSLAGADSQVPTSVSAVGASTAIVAATFARPSDTNVYAVDDVVGSGAVITFANLGRDLGGTGYITNARLAKSTAVITNASFRLWLFSAAPAAIADNSPFTLLWANRAIRDGYIDFACITAGSGSDSASAALANLNIRYSCATDSRSIFGVLTARQAYVPGNAENFFVELTVDQN
jgi:hypothetical protein